MYIVVTGAAGFIGSNIVKALCDRGEYEVLAVDDLTQGDKFVNLVDCDIADYLDKDDFLRELDNGAFDGAIAAPVAHQYQAIEFDAGDARDQGPSDDPVPHARVSHPVRVADDDPRNRRPIA